MLLALSILLALMSHCRYFTVGDHREQIALWGKLVHLAYSHEPANSIVKEYGTVKVDTAVHLVVGYLLEVLWKVEDATVTRTEKSLD